MAGATTSLFALPLQRWMGAARGRYREEDTCRATHTRAHATPNKLGFAVAEGRGNQASEGSTTGICPSHKDATHETQEPPGQTRQYVSVASRAVGANDAGPLRALLHHNTASVSCTKFGARFWWRQACGKIRCDRPAVTTQPPLGIFMVLSVLFPSATPWQRARRDFIGPLVLPSRLEH